MSYVDVSHGAIPLLYNPTVLSAYALESLLHAPRKVVTLALCRGKKKTSTDILPLTPHPLLSQRSPSIFVVFSTQAQCRPPGGTTACYLLSPVIVLPPI